jgi:uncharacterized repeat protein (TIGR01451 family)
MYHDANCDGTVDSPLVQFTGLTPNVAIGTQFCFVVRATVTPGTADGSTGSVAVVANGSGYPSTERTNTDDVTVTGNGSIVVTKSIDVSSGGPGTVITYTLTYTNNGAAAVPSVLLYDALPTNPDGHGATNDGITYVTGSGLWSGSATPLTDAAGDQVLSGTTVNYAATTGTISALITFGTPLAANGTGYIRFRASVGSVATGTLDNTPWFCYHDGTAVVPAACDTGGNPDPTKVAANHETGNTVSFTVLLDFLQKFQALDPCCIGDCRPLTAPGSATCVTTAGTCVYTQSQLTAGAIPGSCIRYKIVATNNTGSTVTGVRIFDQTPTFTVYDDGSRNAVGAPCGGTADAAARTSVGGTVVTGEVTAPACNGTGAVNASIGSLSPLAPGNSAYFTFGVMIQNQ